jgi:DNA-binding NtrC family response regulator
MSAAAAQPTRANPGTEKHDAGARDSQTRTPLCFVVDGDGSIRHFLSLVLHGAGIDTEECADGATFRAALSRRAPDLVFLNIALESAEAIECVMAQGKKGYTGYVQLMSSRGSAVLERVESIGQQQRLQMLPALKKPFVTSAVLAILQELTAMPRRWRPASI